MAALELYSLARCHQPIPECAEGSRESAQNKKGRDENERCVGATEPGLRTRMPPEQERNYERACVRGHADTMRAWPDETGGGGHICNTIAEKLFREGGHPETRAVI